MTEAPWIARLSRAAAALCGLTLAGCLSPDVRYSHEVAADADPGRHLLVPRDWDYRASYRIPRERLDSIAGSFLGTPYHRGGMSRKGMDCSGFVCVVFRELNRARLPRSTGGLKKLGEPVPRDKAAAGDLVFFRGGPFGSVNHVGICIEGSRFVHASTSKGVTYDDLDSDYYRDHFWGIRRLF